MVWPNSTPKTLGLVLFGLALFLFTPFSTVFSLEPSARVLLAPRYGHVLGENGVLVRVNRNALRSKRFRITYGEGQSILVVSEKKSLSQSSFTALGQTLSVTVRSASTEQGRGDYLISSIPSVRRAVVRGLFRLDERQPEFDTLELTLIGRRSYLRLVDTALKRVCDGSKMPSTEDSQDLLPVAPVPLQALASNRVDIAMFYSPKSAKRVGGMSGMIVESALLIRQSNDAFERSAIDAELSLVHLAQSINEENGDISGDLTRVQNGADGFFDEFITTRDGLGADVVVFVQEHASDTACGIAYQYDDPALTYPDFALTVLSRSCIAFLVMPHEIGHILGANHDVDSLQSSGAYPFSRGLRFQIGNGSTVRTIMANGVGTRIGYFSNPNVSYEGVATGNASADNSSAINLLASAVAGYRTLAIPTPTPYTPSGSQPTFAKINSAEFISKTKCKVTATFFNQAVKGISGVAASVTAFNTGASHSPVKFSNNAGKVTFSFKPGSQKKFYVSIPDFDTRTKTFKCKAL